MSTGATKRRQRHRLPDSGFVPLAESLYMAPDAEILKQEPTGKVPAKMTAWWRELSELEAQGWGDTPQEKIPADWRERKGPSYRP